jgi:hypothetical protein
MRLNEFENSPSKPVQEESDVWSTRDIISLLHFILHNEEEYRINAEHNWDLPRWLKQIIETFWEKYGTYGDPRAPRGLDKYNQLIIRYIAKVTKTTVSMVKAHMDAYEKEMDAQSTSGNESVQEKMTPQWKTKSKKPTGKKPPARGNTSPHPARGKMVGEENELAEGIKDDAEAIVQEITAAANKIVGKDKSGRDTFRHFYYPVEYAPPGRTWTRGDGSRYRDPAKLIPGSELRPDYRKQLEQAFGGSLIDYAWKLIQSKGKSIGKVRGEMGSSDYAEAVKVGKTVFIRRSKNTIDVVSPSVFRNMDVWRQKDKSVEEADQPKDGSARSKLNHSLTSRKSGAHADKSKTLPRKAKHKGKIPEGEYSDKMDAHIAKLEAKPRLTKQEQMKLQTMKDYRAQRNKKSSSKVEEAPVETNYRGRVTTGRDAAPPARVTVRSRPNPRPKPKPKHKSKSVEEDLDTKKNMRAQMQRDLADFMNKGGKVDTLKPQKKKYRQGQEFASKHIGGAKEINTGTRRGSLGKGRNVKGNKPVVNASVQESPLVTRTGTHLNQMVGSMFDEFMQTNPDNEQLKDILRIMGKSMDVTGNRVVIDMLKNMGVEESMRGGDLVADIEDKLSFIRYLKHQFARSGDDPETLDEIRRKERELRSQLSAMTTEDADPCWKSHKQVGMKKKGGRSVPNCVPK